MTQMKNGFDSVPTEVPLDEQTAMAIKLTDNVRALIREHLLHALEDPAFIAQLNLYPLYNRITGVYSSDSAFRAAVKTALTNILNNSYG